MMIKTYIFSIILPLIMGCNYEKQLPIDIFYKEAIEQAEHSSKFDGRHDLKICVRNWTLYPERDAMLKTVSKGGFFDSSQYVLLEIGNSGFGIYEYAYIWKTDDSMVMVTNLIDNTSKKYSVKAEHIDEFWNKVITHKKIIGNAARSVVDGNGFFITLKKENFFKQLAIYAPELDKKTNLSDSEQIVQLIMHLVRGAK